MGNLKASDAIKMFTVRRNATHVISESHAVLNKDFGVRDCDARCFKSDIFGKKARKHWILAEHFHIV